MKRRPRLAGDAMTHAMMQAIEAYWDQTDALRLARVADELERRKKVSAADLAFAVRKLRELGDLERTKLSQQRSRAEAVKLADHAALSLGVTRAEAARFFVDTAREVPAMVTAIMRLRLKRKLKRKRDHKLIPK